MKKNGFTLVELLVVIVLIGLLVGLGIPGINKIKENMNNRTFNTKIELLEEAAVFWGQDNKTMLQQNDCTIDSKTYKCKAITIKELIEDDYLDSDDLGKIVYTDPRNGESMLGHNVCVYKKNNRVYAKYLCEISNE